MIPNSICKFWWTKVTKLLLENEGESFFTTQRSFEYTTNKSATYVYDNADLYSNVVSFKCYTLYIYKQASLSTCLPSSTCSSKLPCNGRYCIAPFIKLVPCVYKPGQQQLKLPSNLIIISRTDQSNLASLCLNSSF